MAIKDITGTAEATCACGAWLDHWAKFSGQRVRTCPVVGCNKTDLVGAHVQEVESAGYNQYIYPLCSGHNLTTGVLVVSDYYQLVSANKRETCEK